MRGHLPQAVKLPMRKRRAGPIGTDDWKEGVAAMNSVAFLISRKRRRRKQVSDVNICEQIQTELALILDRKRRRRLGTMEAGSDDLDEGRRYLANTVRDGWHVPTWPRTRR